MSLTKSITATISFVGAGYQVVAIKIPLSGRLEYGYQDRLLRPVDNTQSCTYCVEFIFSCYDKLVIKQIIIFYMNELF